MANGMDNDTGFSPDNPFPISTSYPKELSGYWISDERLEMLGMSRRDALLEAIWGCVGIAAGSALPAIQALEKAYLSQNPTSVLPFLDLIKVSMCTISFVVAIVLAFLWWKRGKTSQDIVTAIREQSN